MSSSRRYLALGAFLLVASLISHGLVVAQTPEPEAVLVIEGGTLIDGNGSAPVADSVIVIRGNTISTVSKRGQVSYPPGAHVINATGRFVMPGLFDSQVSYEWYLAEAFLNYGITSTIDVGTSGQDAVPYRDAVFRGRLRGPRTFTSISRLVAAPAEFPTGLESPYTPSRVPGSVQGARDLVRLWIEAGADYVIMNDGSLPLDQARAAFEEARKAGRPVFTRAYGPVMFPRDAAMMGSRTLPHSAGIGVAVTKDPSKWNKGRDDRNELDRYAEMDEAKANDLIELLVKNNVMLVPTFVINFPGYPKDWERFVAEGHQMFTDPTLLTYYPASAIQSVFNRYTNVDKGAVRERRMKGYQNALRFHKMFVDAGGKIAISGNTNSTKAPGLDLHHEIQVMKDVGLTPMQIVQGTTKWPAEMIGREDRIGTIEAGKLADLIVLDRDPLQDASNMRAINTVIQNGRIVERGYTANYSDPFINLGDPSVDALQWVAAMKANFRPAAQLTDPAHSPQPAIESIAPLIVTQTSGSVTVTLKGLNFVRRSVVFFKGQPVPMRVVSPTEIQVTLDADALSAVGKYDMVVRNPDPIDPAVVKGMWGNGTSNVAHLIVNYRY